MNSKELALQVFNAAVEAVKPDRLIRDFVELRGRDLVIGDQVLRVDQLERILVVGAGKASGLMAQALEQVLGNQIAAGVVVVKYGHAARCEKIQVLEAGHPYPDQAGMEATQRIAALCDSATKRDLVICLWSGGGSSLLADCPPGCDLQTWIGFSKLLVNSGAGIGEINAVRKHLSQVKGGQLARRAYPARVISLALSDVVGDPLDVIASGPTVADTSTYADAADTLCRYGLEQVAPDALVQRIQGGTRGEFPETPKPGDPLLARTRNLVIGSNQRALCAGSAFAQAQGIEARIVTDRLEGNVEEAAEFILSESAKIAAHVKHPCCLLFGGETTLKVQGSGLGGRCQHIALLAARKLRSLPPMTFLAGGTDGTDGPTEMAGAIADETTWDRALDQGLDPESYLSQSDSYHFFKQGGGHIQTGPTMTNVMDIIIVFVR